MTAGSVNNPSFSTIQPGVSTPQAPSAPVTGKTSTGATVTVNPTFAREGFSTTDILATPAADA